MLKVFTETTRGDKSRLFLGAKSHLNFHLRRAEKFHPPRGESRWGARRQLNNFWAENAYPNVSYCACHVSYISNWAAASSCCQTNWAHPARLADFSSVPFCWCCCSSIALPIAPAFPANGSIREIVQWNCLIALINRSRMMVKRLIWGGKILPKANIYQLVLSPKQHKNSACKFWRGKRNQKCKLLIVALDSWWVDSAGPACGELSARVCDVEGLEKQTDWRTRAMKHFARAF